MRALLAGFLWSTLLWTAAAAPRPAAAQMHGSDRAPPLGGLIPPAPFSLHALAGFLDHSMDPGDALAPAVLVGLAYRLDDWVRAEVEMMAASTSGTLACSDSPFDACVASDHPQHLLTLLTGLRVASVGSRFRGFVAIHRGFELTGIHGVFEVAAGVQLSLGQRVALRLDARHRWDDRYLARPNPTGAAFLIGVDLSG